MMTLQNIATRGAPLTREGRLSRHALASALMLSPEVYNYLAFGEREADTDAPQASPALADTALPRHRIEWSSRENGVFPCCGNGIFYLIGGVGGGDYGVAEQGHC